MTKRKNSTTKETTTTSLSPPLGDDCESADVAADAGGAASSEQQQQQDLAAAPAKKQRKGGPSKQTLYLKSLGIVRPPTAYQLWREATKDTLKADIDAGKAPAVRAKAFAAAIGDNGRCNLNKYSGLVWRTKEDGGFDGLSADERSKWYAEYEKTKSEWEQRKATALEKFPKKPLTAYMIFYTKDFRPDYVVAHPDANQPTVSKACSVKWEQIKAAEQARMAAETDGSTVSADILAKSNAYRRYQAEYEQNKVEYAQKKAAFDAKAAQDASTTAEPTTTAPITAKQAADCDDEAIAKAKEAIGNAVMQAASKPATKKRKRPTKKQMAAAVAAAAANDVASGETCALD